jgi:predicted nucleic acid-binding Zn ribbon protein
MQQSVSDLPMSDDNQYTIKEAIQAFMERHGHQDKYNEAQLVNEWEKIMGKMIAQHTTKIYVKNRKLIVYLDSAPLKQELSYAKSKIVNLLNEEVGTEVIEDVIIK